MITFTTTTPPPPPPPHLFFNVIIFLPLETSVYCNIWLLNSMEGMYQSTNDAKKMYTFKSYLFINWKKFPHTKHDKLDYHPIHSTHDTDY